MQGLLIFFINILLFNRALSGVYNDDLLDDQLDFGNDDLIGPAPATVQNQNQINQANILRQNQNLNQQTNLLRQTQIRDQANLLRQNQNSLDQTNLLRQNQNSLDQANLVRNTQSGSLFADYPNTYYNSERTKKSSGQRAKARRLVSSFSIGGNDEGGEGMDNDFDPPPNPTETSSSHDSVYSDHYAAGSNTGGGWGWTGWKGWDNNGWGWSGGSGGKAVSCNSALGLLGTLGLVSFLQSVLRQMTTTMAMMSGRSEMMPGRSERKERSVDQDHPDDLEQRITRKMLPLLNAVAHAQDGRIPLKCTQLEICRANKILVAEMGAMGRNIGQMLTKAIGKMLKEVDPGKGLIVKAVNKSAKEGRSGGVCERIYPLCPELKKIGNIYLPTIQSLTKT